MAVPLAFAPRAVANYLGGRVYCASFELTHNCNARCRHCHRGDPVPNEQRATPARLLEVCRQLCPIVAVISGGEPLLCSDVDEIVHTLKLGCAPLRVFLNTNAGLLTCDRLVELGGAGVDETLISFDYPDERHDQYRQIPGLFRHIEALVGETAPKRRKSIVLTTVLQRDNFKEAPRMAEVARAWGVNINFSAYTWLRTNDRTLMIAPPETGELREVIDRLRTSKREHGHILTSDYVFQGMVTFFENGSMPGCRAGKRFLVVNPDGTLSPCGLLIRGYATRTEMIRDFTRGNHCASCYTSSRGNSERPLRFLLLDHLRYLNS